MANPSFDMNQVMNDGYSGSWTSSPVNGHSMLCPNHLYFTPDPGYYNGSDPAGQAVGSQNAGPLPPPPPPEYGQSFSPGAGQPGYGTTTYSGTGLPTITQSASAPWPTPVAPGTGGTGAGGGASGSGSNPNAGMTADQQQNALDIVYQAYPWLRDMGLASQLQAWVVEGLSPEAIVAEVRQTSQWAAMFPGIRRTDGTLRMNEGTYEQRVDEFRQLMKQYGRPSSEYSSPQNFAGLFQNDIDPNEFKQRLETYDQVQRSSPYVKAAFYVYAGMNVTTDQLYQALVDPAAQAKITSEYNQRIALGGPDYNTFIQRATEFALSNAGDQATQMFGPGSTTAKSLQSIDPAHATILMDNLYHGQGYSGGTPPPLPNATGQVPATDQVPTAADGQPQVLDLQQLLHAFQNALIGGAATANGLRLPDQRRVEQFRQAGITMADALSGYGQIATNQNDWTGALQRSGLGHQFGQDQLENALFLKTSPDLNLLQRAEASDKALQDQGGNFAFQMNQRTGELEQRGLRASLA